VLDFALRVHSSGG